VKLEQKKEVAGDLHDRFSKAKTVIATYYKGLDVTTLNSLRGRLREAGVQYKVVKNSLLKRAAADTNVDLIKEHFTGPTAVALSYDDPVAIAKILIDFSKENEKLEIRIGIMNDKVIDFENIKVLASLPSREILIATLLSCLNSIPCSFVRTLNAIPGSFVNLLRALKDKKEQQ
jgi:large subunit ribosomal protein L10